MTTPTPVNDQFVSTMFSYLNSPRNGLLEKMAKLQIEDTTMWVNKVRQQDGMLKSTDITNDYIKLESCKMIQMMIQRFTSELMDQINDTTFQTNTNTTVTTTISYK
jgi:hypothetical protein